MTHAGFLCGGVFALGLGAAVLAGAGAASADSADSGSVKPAHSHATGSAPDKIAKRQPTARPLVAVPKTRGSQAHSARVPAAQTSTTGAVTSANLPPSYSVTYRSHAFLDGSRNVEVTGVYSAEGAVDDAEIYALHADGDAFVAYTRLYLNQNVNVPLAGGWEVKAFDPGVFPGDLGLTEISAGLPRRLPNSASENDRERVVSVLGLIPVAAQVAGAVSLLLDGVELSDAQRRGDIDDIADELADLRVDLIDDVLGVRQLQFVAVAAIAPVALAASLLFVVAQF